MGAFVDRSGRLFLGHVQAFQWEGSNGEVIAFTFFHLGFKVKTHKWQICGHLSCLKFDPVLSLEWT